MEHYKISKLLNDFERYQTVLNCIEFVTKKMDQRK